MKQIGLFLITFVLFSGCDFPEVLKEEEEEVNIEIVCLKGHEYFMYSPESNKGGLAIRLNASGRPIPCKKKTSIVQ